MIYLLSIDALNKLTYIVLYVKKKKFLKSTGYKKAVLLRNFFTKKSLIKK